MIKKIISVTSHALDSLPCHKLSHFLGPPPRERDVLYGRPHVVLSKQVNMTLIKYNVHVTSKLLTVSVAVAGYHKNTRHFKDIMKTHISNLWQSFNSI